MLTPVLQQIREQIEARSKHSKAEERLLVELKAIDEALEEKKPDVHHMRERTKKRRQIVAGPGRCPCCGR